MAVCMMFTMFPIFSSEPPDLERLKPASEELERDTTPFIVLDQGLYGVANMGVFAWSTENSMMWNTWSLIFGNRMPQSVRTLDLTKHTLVVIAVGTRPTGGYEVGIPEVFLEDQGLVVEYYERTPEPGTMVTQAFTYPYIMIAVEGQYMQVEFRKVDPR